MSRERPREETERKKEGKKGTGKGYSKQLEKKKASLEDFEGGGRRKKAESKVRRTRGPWRIESPPAIIKRLVHIATYTTRTKKGGM